MEWILIETRGYCRFFPKALCLFPSFSLSVSLSLFHSLCMCVCVSLSLFYLLSPILNYFSYPDFKSVNFLQCSRLALLQGSKSPWSTKGGKTRKKEKVSHCYREMGSHMFTRRQFRIWEVFSVITSWIMDRIQKFYI